MVPAAPHLRLKRARAERGEDLQALSARTGVRLQHLRAIEDGRFGDLPPGIYGRGAVRSFAAAYALDATALLAECEALLPPLEDPIDALARMRGVRTAPHAATPVDVAALSPRSPSPPSPPTGWWRAVSAVALDAAAIGALFAMVCAGAAFVAGTSMSALRASDVPLTLVGMVLAAGYFAWFGGLAGTTPGRWMVLGERPAHDGPVTLAAIAARALRCATGDARGLLSAGAWRLTSARSAQPNAPLPSPPRPRDPLEALTFSMSRQASVPPPPLHPRRG